MRVEENVIARTSAFSFGRGRVYTIRMQFWPPAAYPPELGVTFQEVAATFQGEFVDKMRVGGWGRVEFK